MMLRCMSLLMLGLVAGGRVQAEPAGQAGSVVQVRLRTTAFDETHGLSSRTIECATRDRDGFPWFGTSRGLYRFDGFHFELVTLRADYRAPRILSLHPHPQGGVWVGTVNGLAWAKGSTVQWAQIDQAKVEPSVDSLATDEAGNLWFTAFGALGRQTSGMHFAFDPVARGWKGPIQAAITRLRGGVIIRDANGLLHRRSTDGQWMDLPALPHHFGALALDGQQRLWSVRKEEVYQLDTAQPDHPPQTFQLRNPIMDGSLVLPDEHGRVWVATSGGVEGLGQGPHLVVDRKDGLPEDDLFMVMPDRDGRLWMGGIGVYRQNGLGWLDVKDRRDGLPGNVVWAVRRFRRTGQLVVGTESGLALEEGGRFQLVPGTERMSIRVMEEDLQGNLWIGTWGDGLHLMRAGARRTERVQALPATSAAVRLLTTPDGGVLIFGPRANLLTLRLEGGRVVETEIALPKGPTGTAAASAFCFDSLGRLWVGNWYGLHLHEGNQWRTFGKADGLLDPAVLDLKAGAHGDVWLRYEEPVGGSRIRLERDRIRVEEHLDERSGLSTTVFFGLFPGREAGEAWILSDRGLLHRRGGRWLQVVTADGMPTNDCSEGAFWQDVDGTTYVGTSRGMVIARPGCFPERPPVPAARITSVSDGRSTWLLPGDAVPARFPFRGSSLTFRFSTAAMGGDGDLRFQVRLEGLEDEWRPLESPAATYARLREGSYVLRVQAARQGEAWGNEATYAFQILPPWYRTWWAWTLWLVGSVGVLVGLVRLRLQGLVRQRDQLEGMVKERTQEIEMARQALEAANESLRTQSLTDPLTGLGNRRMLEVSLPQDIRKVLHLYRRAGQNGRRGDLKNPDLVFMLVDMDHFKRVNDVHGHHAGDLVLKQTAQILREAVRDTDAIIRWGGEEFLVVLRDTCRTEAPMLAERIRRHVEEHPFEAGVGESLRLTCSVGFAPFPIRPEDPEQLAWHSAIDLADLCLYLVKRSGRNGWLGMLDFLVTPQLPWTPKDLQALVAEGQATLRTSLGGVAWGGVTDLP